MEPLVDDGINGPASDAFPADGDENAFDGTVGAAPQCPGGLAELAFEVDVTNGILYFFCTQV